MHRSPVLNETLKDSVQIINNVKAKPLSARLFALICSEMNSEHNTLLLHAEVRWLSRGKTLSRLFELRKELISVFEEYVKTNQHKRKKKPNKRRAKQSKSADAESESDSDREMRDDENEFLPLPEEIFLAKLKDDEWMSTLAYLSDIFGYLNELNLRTQGRKMDCFDFWNKIEAFQKKLVNWQRQVKAKDLSSFSLTNELVEKNRPLVDYIQPIMSDHLGALIGYFQLHFPERIDPRAFHLWVVNPFLNISEPDSLTSTERNQLLGNIFDNRFNRFTLSIVLFFWSRFHRANNRSHDEKFIRSFMPRGVLVENKKQIQFFESEGARQTTTIRNNVFE